MINLTQHIASPEQVEAGVIDLAPEIRIRLQGFLTFNEIPSCSGLNLRAQKIVDLVPEETKTVMIGGAPFLMTYLEAMLFTRGIQGNYAFSRRESVESEVEGMVVKRSVFRHLGFVTT